jgi:hypothetical protein
MFTTNPDDDDHDNNILAAGALLAMLWVAERPLVKSIRAVEDEDGPTNQIDVSFSFLLSPYRITIERVPD